MADGDEGFLSNRIDEGVANDKNRSTAKLDCWIHLLIKIEMSTNAGQRKPEKTDKGRGKLIDMHGEFVEKDAYNLLFFD